MKDHSQSHQHPGTGLPEPFPLPADLTRFCLGTGYRRSPSSLAGRAAQICSRDFFKCCHPAFNPCLTTSFFPGQKRFIRESFTRGGAHDLRPYRRRGPPTAPMLPRTGLHQGVGVHQVSRPSLEPADCLGLKETRLVFLELQTVISQSGLEGRGGPCWSLC